MGVVQGPGSQLPFLQGWIGKGRGLGHPIFLPRPACLLSPFLTLVPASPSLLWVVPVQYLLTLDTATVPPKACHRHKGLPHGGGLSGDA